MRLQCFEHGEVEQYRMSGYSVACEGPVKASPRDFERITFFVENPEGSEVGPEHISTKDESEDYLKKFAGWREDIAEVIEECYNTGRGVELFTCSHRDRMCPTYVVDEVFEYDFNGDVSLDVRIVDGVFNVDEIRRYGDYSEGEIVDILIDEAKQANSVEKMYVETRYPDRLEDVLENRGFDVESDGSSLEAELEV